MLHFNKRSLNVQLFYIELFYSQFNAITSELINFSKIPYFTFSWKKKINRN